MSQEFRYCMYPKCFLEVKLGTEWLKLLKNWLLSISAFCKSFVTRAELGASRAGIEDSFLVSNLRWR